MHDADHCICLRTVAYFVSKKDRLHGYGPRVEKRSGGLQSRKHPHDHPFSGAAVRSAKPLGDTLDFRRTDNKGRTGSAEAAAPFLSHENTGDGISIFIEGRSLVILAVVSYMSALGRSGKSFSPPTDIGRRTEPCMSEWPTSRHFSLNGLSPRHLLYRMQQDALVFRIHLTEEPTKLLQHPRVLTRGSE